MSKRISSKKVQLPIAITTGDHRGIGPEIIAKGLKLIKKNLPLDEIIIFGDPALYKPFQKLLGLQFRTWSEEEFLDPLWTGPKARTLNFVLPDDHSRPSSIRAAYFSGRYIELAVKGALEGRFRAIVTGPIDKFELQRGGYPFDGHTGMLQHMCANQSPLSARLSRLLPLDEASQKVASILPVTMMLAAPQMRVSLVTTHVPLREVASRVTTDKILTCIKNTDRGLKDLFRIKNPRIAVLALNPHAGDNGLFGTEEQDFIAPAIQQAHQFGILAEGPFPADGFFAQWKSRHRKRYDAVVCQYHDQGLIPIKLFDFENTVNITLGLPIVRTSVDHGIGLDIAGKNKADPSSFLAALNLALQVTRPTS